jgi:hypothetical protein
MLEKLKAFARSLDPKLVVTVASIGAARAVLALGGDPVDPLWAAVISLAVGAVAGFYKANDGTVLRRPQESGNAFPPPGVRL